jgi:hypothetical protein
MCRWMMTSGLDATAPPPQGGPPLVTVLQSPPPGASRETWVEHVNTTRHALSYGRVVAILGACESEPPYEWNEACLCDVASLQPDGAPIEWHCKFVLYQSFIKISKYNLASKHKRNAAGKQSSSTIGGVN